MSAHASAAAASDLAFFERSVRPMLVRNCVGCHGTEQAAAGLRVDSREALLAGGQSGPAIIPGDTEASLLASKEDHHASARDLELLSQWIAVGAPWPDAPIAEPTSDAPSHWAFQPLREPVVPVIEGDSDLAAIDAFLEAQRREMGLTAMPRADKRTLIRRATFDLTGLPPTPAEIAAFEADDSADAWSRLIERLLASPEYGRKWGRHWLDIARYADTAGDTSDFPIPQARLYRDYVVDAFNEDLSYDQFIREQLAGDILVSQDPSTRLAERTIATGFLALSQQFGPQPRAQPHLIIENAINTLGEGLLGLSIGCARCHDHKHDPIPIDDYYALYGILESTVFPHAGGEESPQPGGWVPVTDDPQLRQEFIAYSERRLELGNKMLLAARGRDKDHSVDEYRKMFEELVANAPQASIVAFAVRESDNPHDARVQLAGEPGKKGPVVRRGFLSALSDNPRPETLTGSGRLELAEWIASPGNPLTARVMVNRIWQNHFTTPLVPTPNNFGLRGLPPLHQHLLDYLACRFIDSGWSVKDMHRLIMQSQAYQMSSLSDDSNVAIDASNQWYWSFQRRRLTGEEIRDAMLMVSGELDLSTPGEHPFPPTERWNVKGIHYTQHKPFHAVYPSAHRSIYLMTQRLHPHPFLGLFDPPDRTYSTPMRRQSIVPLQALFMMNSEFIQQRAEALASRVLAHSESEIERLRFAHELLWGVVPSDAELSESMTILAQLQQRVPDGSADGGDAQSTAWTSYARVLLTSNPFMFVD